MSEAIQSKVISALYDCLGTGLNSALLALDQSPLPEGALDPLGPSVRGGDTIGVLYAGTTRDPKQKNAAFEDVIVSCDIMIYAFAQDHLTAQLRAIALECATAAVLNHPANRYLGGLLDLPLAIDDSEVPYGGEHQGQMAWQTSLRVQCQTRLRRPELELT